MDDYELYHYGVKGMKWGVIRWKDKLGYGRSTVTSVDSNGKASGFKGLESW